MGVSNFASGLGRGLNAAAIVTLGLISVALLAYTIACALGFAPWLTISARFGDTLFENAGMSLQLIATVLMTALLFYLPASFRVLRLEASHRSFHVSMDDVSRAYHVCHAADRSGVFTLSSEFDAVRERLAFMRDHPDLSELEPETLTLAAQMSQQARELSDVYSDEKVERAKAFLRQRQTEIEDQQRRIVEARHALGEIKNWTQQIEMEENVVASQLEMLHEQLEKALPALGMSLKVESKPNVVAIPKKPQKAAE